MSHKKVLFVLVAALAATAVAISTAQAQQRGRGGPRGGSRSSILRLLGMEEVQKEIKLTDEETAKVKEVVDKLRGAMREQYGALESVEDRAERREKMTKLSDEFERKAREELRGVIPREKMMRVYQIRMQVQSAIESLVNRFVAGRLELTDEQKAKLEEISKDLQAKQSELFGKMREAEGDQRSELFQKMRELRTQADAKALALLTDAQKKSFEEMKGEKFELPTRRGRRPSN